MAEARADELNDGGPAGLTESSFDTDNEQVYDNRLTGQPSSSSRR